MTDKIIALVDGSDYSRSVCEHAAWIAGRTGQKVELMHVLGRREAGGAGSDLSGAISLGARSALLKDLAGLDEQRAKLALQRGRAILQDAREMIDAAGAEAGEHLRRGDLIEAIGEVEEGAEMILMGKRGEAADFAKGHLGSNLERVMRQSHKPLFVASRAFTPIETAVLAFDGSAGAMRAVEHVAASPLYEGLDLEVVHVGAESEATRTGLDDAVARLRAAGRQARATRLDGDVEEALADHVARDGVGHLVMGASGHSRLRALFVGSTSLEMIRTCKVPVLLVP